MNTLRPNQATALARDGYAIISDVIPAEAVAGLIAAIDLLADADGSRQRNGAAYAIRNLLSGHRRVIHLEFASGPLPGGLEWYEH